MDAKKLTIKYGRWPGAFRLTRRRDATVSKAAWRGKGGGSLRRFAGNNEKKNEKKKNWEEED